MEEIDGKCVLDRRRTAWVDDVRRRTEGVGETRASCYRGVLCKTIIPMDKSPTAIVS